MTTSRIFTSVSRRHVLASAAGSGLALAASGRVVAQGATPMAGAAHPFVGVWVLDTDIDDPSNPPEILVVTADGGYISSQAGGVVSNGVWEATGESTANLTIHGINSDESGAFAGMFIVRAAIEVDASGASFTAPYTFELVDAEGTATGQYGPVTAKGTRLVAEPMGTPVGPLNDLFGQSGSEEGEEASPAAG